MIKQNFNDFVDVQISKYSNYKTQNIHFVGSVAFHFNEILSEVMRERNLKLGKIISNPIEELVRFHMG